MGQRLRQRLIQMEIRKIAAVVVRAPQTTQNLVISRCCFAEEAKDVCRDL